MKLSDVMSAAGLAGYAEVGLCIFLLVFLSVVVRTFAQGQVSQHSLLERLPLLGEEPPLLDELPSAPTLTERSDRG